MNRFCTLCLPILVCSSAAAQTNLPPSTSVLLDESAVMGLTAELSQYESVSNLTGKLTSMGSGITTVLVNRWAAEFSTIYPGVELNIHGGGTPEGLHALLDDKADLVPGGRLLSKSENEPFQKKFGYVPLQIMVALDAVAVYVNKDNPIAGLTLAQLDSIYSRDAKRGGGRPEFWRDLGVIGPFGDKQIRRVSLNRHTDNYLFFRDAVMEGEDFRFDVDFEPVPTSLVQAPGADDRAIAFASVMFATARTRFVPLQATDGRYLPANYQNITSGDYPLVRPMRIIFNRKRDGSLNPVAREFLRFAVSRRGQRIIGLAGTYPLNLQQQKEALAAIGGTP